MIIQYFTPVPALSSKPEYAYLHWSFSQTPTPLTLSFVLQIHTFVAHTDQTHCWSQRWVWEAGRVSAPLEGQVKKLISISPHRFRTPPILSLSPSRKKSSLLQQLTVTLGPSTYLGCVLYGMQYGMERAKDFETKRAMPAASVRKRWVLPCAMGSHHPTDSGPTLCRPTLFLHCC